MKNGIAMTSKRSMPVNSFSATEVIGTVVIVNRKVSTVRPSEIDTGMPVSISPNSSRKMISQRGTCRPAAKPSSGRMTIAAGSAASRRIELLIGRLVHERPPRLHIGRMQVVPHPERIDVERRNVFESFDEAVIVMRQFAGPVERPGNLQEAEAHQDTIPGECTGTRSTAAAPGPPTPGRCGRSPRRSSRPGCRR